MRTLTVALVAALASVAPGFEVNPAYPWSVRNNTIRVRRWGSPVDIPAMDAIAAVEALTNVQGRMTAVLLSGRGSRYLAALPPSVPHPRHWSRTYPHMAPGMRGLSPHPPSLSRTPQHFLPPVPAVDSKNSCSACTRLPSAECNLKPGAGSDRPGGGRSPAQTGP